MFGGMKPRRDHASMQSYCSTFWHWPRHSMAECAPQSMQAKLALLYQCVLHVLLTFIGPLGST